MATGRPSRLVAHAGAVAAAAARWVWRESPRPRRTPFTFCYLAVLAVTSVVLLAVPGPTAHRLLARSSTDVFHLRTMPVRVLVTSALWLPGLDGLLYAPVFGLIVAPVERRLRSRWVVAVFASGHVIATLLTELPLAWAIRHGYLGPRNEHRLDVGVSYGFYAALGVFVGLLPCRARRPALAAATATAAGALLVAADSLTALGHLVALLVGLAWWPWLARRGLLGCLRS